MTHLSPSGLPGLLESLDAKEIFELSKKIASYSVSIILLNYSKTATQGLREYFKKSSFL